MTITAEQMRAARAMLRIEQGALAESAGVSIETIKRFEAMKGPIKGRDDTIEAIAAVFRSSGLEFIGTAGIRFVEPNGWISAAMEMKPNLEHLKREAERHGAADIAKAVSSILKRLPS